MSSSLIGTAEIECLLNHEMMHKCIKHLTVSRGACQRRCMHIFRAVCALLPLLELLNMQNVINMLKMRILKPDNWEILI